MASHWLARPPPIIGPAPDVTMQTMQTTTQFRPCRPYRPIHNAYYADHADHYPMQTLQFMQTTTKLIPIPNEGPTLCVQFLEALLATRGTGGDGSEGPSKNRFPRTTLLSKTICARAECASHAMHLRHTPNTKHRMTNNTMARQRTAKGLHEHAAK